MLFGVGNEKSEDAHSSHDEHSVIPETIKALKKNFGDKIFVITDVCLCAYTTHGHCGLMKDEYVDNDSSLPVISQMALAHAKAGADMVAPSDMMDGRVLRLRQGLDAAGFHNVGIMSYSAKYASAFYGPFRDALDSAPREADVVVPKDKKTYQMDYANRIEAVKEALWDVEEGADMVMVKPGIAYLDIVREVKNAVNVPVTVFHVSGEYAMIKAAAERGWLDNDKIMMEQLMCIKRAGASLISTYFAKEAAIILNQK